MSSRDEPFSAFVVATEPRLRRALVATYGPHDGRQATVDALAWAWENWQRVESLDNPGGYLYRVGQTAVQSFATRAIPISHNAQHDDPPDANPEVLRALKGLPAQQRAAVLLVHGFGWTERDVASILDVTPSTVHTHIQRALARLRSILEVSDVC